MAYRFFDRGMRVWSAATLATALVLPVAAAAQTAGAPPTAPQWVKICSPDPNTKKSLCLVQQEIHADTGQFIVSATLRTIQDDPKITFIVGVPPGLLIQPGLRAQIDNGMQYEVKYSICFPNTCFADLEVDSAFIKALKAGGQLTILAITQQGKTIPFPISLVGFTKAYDGEGLDPNSASGQAQLDALSQSLKAHADEARQRLIEQQQLQRGTSQP